MTMLDISPIVPKLAAQEVVSELLSYFEDKEHRKEFEEWYLKTYGKQYVWRKFYEENQMVEKI